MAVTALILQEESIDPKRQIIEVIQYRKTNYVVEANIRGFFDNVDHNWLMKILELGRFSRKNRERKPENQDGV